jgi:hypothetical protein
MKEYGIDTVNLDSKNNILTVCAVGKKYTECVTQALDRYLKNGWHVHILTDKPELFHNCETYLYTNTVFSYFDKLTFSLRVLKKLGRGTVLIDADKLELISDKFINESHNYGEFRYYSVNRWAPYFSNLQENGGWKVVYDYFKYLDMDISNIRNFWEEVLYFPHDLFSFRQLTIDLETLKPIFEYRSIIDGFQRPCLGEGEGVALGFLLEKYNFDAVKFECEVFPNNNPFNGKEQLI